MSPTSYTGPTITAEQLATIRTNQIKLLAQNGREWLRAEAAKLKNRRGYGANEDGTSACIRGYLEDLRDAWKLAK